jgi:diguanylate cyclase (GGDEF)-like protein
MMLLGLGGIWLLLLNAAHEENHEFHHLLQSQVAAGTEDLTQAVGKVTRDYAVWDEFDAKVNRPQPDMQWLHRNLTPSVYENLNVDVALLIDPSKQQILYGIKNGKILNNPYHGLQLPASAWDWFRQAQQRPHGAALLTALRDTEDADGRRQNILYLVAVHPIEAENAASTKPHNGKLLLFARQIDRDLLQTLSRSYQILDPQVIFSAPLQGNIMSQPIHGLNGRVEGYLSWRFNPPGDEQLTMLLPGASALCALLLILGFLLSHKAKQLQAGQESTLLRLERQGTLQRSIALNTEGWGRNLQDLEQLCRRIAETLEVDRIGIWRHDHDNQKLHCIVGVDTQESSTLQGVDIAADPDYLAQITLHRYLCLDELSTTQNTSSFMAYASKNRLNSILDVTVRIGKEVRAIISAESRRPRRWTQDEINFICGAADGIALLTESSARQAAEGELTSLFYYDRVTGLPNHHRFRMHLDTLTSARNARAGACVLMDLSNLGVVTEAYGQHVGDQLLTRIAERLEHLMRAGEMAACTGEARFALWLEGATEAELTGRLNRLQQALQQPLLLDGFSIHPSSQIGVSLFPGDGHNADTLLAHARSALRHARQLNSQSWVRFNSGMSHAHSENHRLQMALREALSLGQLHLHYQPIIHLGSHRVIGAEALLRWTHPEKGEIAPDVFIPLAEADETLINRIGAWVLDQACAQAARWRQDYDPLLTMAINVSVKQMEAVGFHQLVSETLSRHALPPQAIELEVTESIALSDTSELEVNLQALQHKKIRLAIDDFGTGYASFSYLRRFPVARLKVDRQFFDQVPANLQRSNLVKTIVSMGHTLGAEVIGEGVEHADQVSFLQSVGCDLAQGYFFSRPLDPAAMAEFLLHSPYSALADPETSPF